MAGWAPEPPATAEVSLLPLHCKDRLGGERSSTDLFSALAIAPRFLISHGFALSWEQGPGGTGRPWFSALFWRLRPLGSAAGLLPSCLARTTCPSLAPLGPGPLPSSASKAQSAPMLGRRVKEGASPRAERPEKHPRGAPCSPRAGSTQGTSGQRDGDTAQGWRRAARGCDAGCWVHPEAGTGQRLSLHPLGAPVRTGLPVRG